jgi:adenosylcobinamide kinase/adenosylcobinamide-phosphate guanylyltransferase
MNLDKGRTLVTRSCILVLGGVRSGKSRWAEHLAGLSPPVTYVATAQVGDEEMARRIAVHRHRRPAAWQTIEAPWGLETTLARTEDEGTVLIDCLTLWITNRLVGLADHAAEDDRAIEQAIDDLARALAAPGCRVVVVSGEVGCGIMPINAVARRFGDLVGLANQRLAEVATEVYWCVAGLPQRIKGPGGSGDDRTGKPCSTK